MNEAWAKLVSCDQDVTNVIRWWLVKKAPSRYVRMAMAVGGFREVIQETCLTFLRKANPPDLSCHWSTAAIQQTRWTILLMFKRWMAKAEANVVFLHDHPHVLTVPNEQVDIAIRNELTATVSRCLDSLSYREKTVVELRMEGMTLEQVGRVLQITRERVRQVESKAHRKLQQPGVARNLFEFLDE